MPSGDGQYALPRKRESELFASQNLTYYMESLRDLARGSFVFTPSMVFNVYIMS